MSDNNDLKNITITQDKLVDILMHSATREDIAALRQEVKEDIASVGRCVDKMDRRIDKLENKIDTNFKWVVGLLVASVLVPIALKLIH